MEDIKYSLSLSSIIAPGKRIPYRELCCLSCYKAQICLELVKLQQANTQVCTLCVCIIPVTNYGTNVTYLSIQYHYPVTSDVLKRARARFPSDCILLER